MYYSPPEMIEDTSLIGTYMYMYMYTPPVFHWPKGVLERFHCIHIHRMLANNAIVVLRI